MFQINSLVKFVHPLHFLQNKSLTGKGRIMLIVLLQVFSCKRATSKMPTTNAFLPLELPFDLRLAFYERTLVTLFTL